MKILFTRLWDALIVEPPAHCEPGQKWMRIERSSLPIFLLCAGLMLTFALAGLLQWQIVLAGLAGGVIAFIAYWFSMAGFDHAQFIGLVTFTLLGAAVYKATGGAADKTQIGVMLCTALMQLSAIAMLTRRLRQLKNPTQ